MLPHFPSGVKRAGDLLRKMPSTLYLGGIKTENTQMTNTNRPSEGEPLARKGQPPSLLAGLVSGSSSPSVREVRRVIVYFDWESLRRALRECRKLSFMWLNPLVLAQCFLSDSSRQGFKYTIRIKNFATKTSDASRQFLWRALEKSADVKPHLGEKWNSSFDCPVATQNTCEGRLEISSNGFPKSRSVQCKDYTVDPNTSPECTGKIAGQQKLAYKFRLTAEMAADAASQAFDLAYLVSADDAFGVGIDALRENYNVGEIVVALPIGSKAHRLSDAVSQNRFTITEKMLEFSQFDYPKDQERPDGMRTTFNRPKAWKIKWTRPYSL